MIMSSNNLNYNKTTLTSATTQNLWCRDTYWQHISNVLGYNPFKETNGCRLRKCQYEPNLCRGAHCSQDIKTLKHISSYNRLDKTKYDWIQLYKGIVSSIQSDAPRVTLEEHKRKIADISTKNFIEIIQMWRDFACYYRKISKEIPFKRSTGNPSVHSSGFKYSDDVPGFYLNGSLEDVAWAFERLTRYCNTHKSMEANISRKQQITVWDLCLATGINCKEGVHYADEHICPNNFLTGICSCPSKQANEEKEAELYLKKIELATQLTKLIEDETKNKVDNEWSSNGKKKNKSKTPDLKIELRSKINAIDVEIAELTNSVRMIHYTELGMIPFEIQLQAYQEAEEAKKLIPVEEIVKPKESWDHGIENISNVPSKAIKVTKLGKKK